MKASLIANWLLVSITTQMTEKYSTAMCYYWPILVPQQRWKTSYWLDCTLPVCLVHSTKHDLLYWLTPNVKIVAPDTTCKQNVWFEGGCDIPLESESHPKKINLLWDIEAWPNWSLSHPQWKHNFLEESKILSRSISFVYFLLLGTCKSETR